MALGAGSVTPIQMVAGYSIFANGGYRVQPYFIDRIVDARGAVLAQTKPVRAGESAERVIDARNAFIMTSLMQDVVRHGTATKAMQLGARIWQEKPAPPTIRSMPGSAASIPNLVAVAGSALISHARSAEAKRAVRPRCRYGSSYMGKALKNVAESNYPVPDGISVIKINPQNGLRYPTSGIPEFFYHEFPPPSQNHVDR